MIAKQFHTFDAEVFTYFFAQYYAQDDYRGSVIKIAPISEKRFDEPFDKLDAYFRAWGDGHSTSEIVGAGLQKKPTTPLTVVYLPQYVVNGLRVLPYTPLSLDALKSEKKNHVTVCEQLIMLDKAGDPGSGRTRLLEALANTPLYHRNRLVADLLSFLMLAVGRVPPEELDSCCRELGLRSFSDTLRALDSDVWELFSREVAAQDGGEVRALWKTWLENIEVDSCFNYMPLHVYIMLFDESDWQGPRLDAAVNIVNLARCVHERLTC